MTIRIRGAGLQTTVQDLGRPNHLRQAVPGGGAMDRVACRVANLLAGNEDGAAVLEATLIGPSIEFLTPTLLAITGGDLSPMLDDRAIPNWHAVLAARGSILRFGKAKAGCRAYIAFGGGIDVPLVFGSRSTYLRAAFGGVEGRALRGDDVLCVGAPDALTQHIAESIPADGAAPGIARWSAGATLRPHYSAAPVVRLIEGTHTSLLTAESRETLFNASFRVSASSDRMGYRLEATGGSALALERPVELLSEAVTFGTMQLPPGGAPIVLMADRQTTGGYPRIGEVASVDLPLVAQLKPGDSVRFQPVSLDDAQSEYLVHEAELAQARAGIAWQFMRGRK
ncbi:MAG TPA: biotin-dependent carboxyltransferase family protein [Gemmatimonadaceae bacterium]|nr:biotin-dependent carboxyltransferase family protein [Gemmatimonadaceae bacterium]